MFYTLRWRDLQFFILRMSHCFLNSSILICVPCDLYLNLSPKVMLSHTICYQGLIQDLNLGDVR